VGKIATKLREKEKINEQKNGTKKKQKSKQANKQINKKAKTETCASPHRARTLGYLRATPAGRYYRKISLISPGLIQVRKGFWVGL